MARQTLNWYPTRHCYRKKYLGKTYYLAAGECRSKSDQQGFQKALAEWQSILASLNRGNGQNAPNGQQHALAVGVLSPNHPVVFASDYSTRFGSAADKRLTSGEKNLDKLIEVYLAEKRSEHEAGQISIKIYLEHRHKLDDFKGFAESLKVRLIDEVTAATLGDYREEQVKRIPLKKPNGISPATAKKRLACLKRFLEWCYQLEAIDKLPRNLTRNYSKVPSSKPSPLAYTPEEVRKLFKASSKRTQLYIALALNCGYTQRDISTLKREHVDWKAKTISRPRAKTGTKQVHKLWGVTADLLADEMALAKHPTLLVSESGGNLLSQELTPDGKMRETDCVKLAYHRVTKRIYPGDKRTFKVLRKSAANEIEKHYPDNPQLASDFLGHTEKATKRFYVGKHHEKLFEAIAYLETLYDLK